MLANRVGRPSMPSILYAGHECERNTQEMRGLNCVNLYFKNIFKIKCKYKFQNLFPNSLAQQIFNQSKKTIKESGKEYTRIILVHLTTRATSSHWLYQDLSTIASFGYSTRLLLVFYGDFSR